MPEISRFLGIVIVMFTTEHNPPHFHVHYNDYRASISIMILSLINGKSGVVDISKIVSFQGVFEPLKDKTFFAHVAVNPEIGTICWENGADISPSVLLDHIQNTQKNAA